MEAPLLSLPTRCPLELALGLSWDSCLLTKTSCRIVSHVVVGPVSKRLPTALQDGV